MNFTRKETEGNFKSVFGFNAFKVFKLKLILLWRRSANFYFIDHTIDFGSIMKIFILVMDQSWKSYGISFTWSCGHPNIISYKSKNNDVYSRVPACLHFYSIKALRWLVYWCTAALCISVINKPVNPIWLTLTVACLSLSLSLSLSPHRENWLMRVFLRNQVDY